MDVPCTPITPANNLQNELSYEMTFTCISSGHCIHRNNLQLKKRKEDKAGILVKCHMKRSTVMLNTKYFI